MSDKPRFKLVVDAERCVGHGRCYDVAPRVFASGDDEGHARVLMPIVPDDALALARLAERSCPEGAVVLSEIDEPATPACGE